MQELLKEQNLTLEKAMDTGRAMEAAKKELHSRPGMQAPVTEANISSLDSALGVGCSGGSCCCKSCKSLLVP